MKRFRSLLYPLLALSLLPMAGRALGDSATPAATAGEAPFIDAAAVRERFKTITAQDMDHLRGRRVLVLSRSLGLNLMGGISDLAKQDKMFDFARQRFNLEDEGGPKAVPADAFEKPGIVLGLGTRHPLIRRVEEVDELIRKEPWKFGQRIDVVMVIYSAINEKVFADYGRIMDSLRADYPSVCFLYATASLNADAPQRRQNAQMHAFSELLRKHYRGRAPIYDLGAILSDDFRDGLLMRPQYTKDPTGVHPNLPEGRIAMAQGFILAMRDGLRWQREHGGRLASATRPATPVAAGPEPALSPDHPDYRAVRAILDHNGLKTVRVEGQIEVRDGRVVGLYIQEAGVTEITDAIGELKRLEKLHVYADRDLGRPFLKTVSPAIGRCVELEELLLNGNDLATLPSEVTKLTALKSLSLAGNRLRDLAPEVEAWARRFDAEGLEQQRRP